MIHNAWVSAHYELTLETTRQCFIVFLRFSGNFYCTLCVVLRSSVFVPRPAHRGKQSIGKHCPLCYDAEQRPPKETSRVKNWRRKGGRRGRRLRNSMALSIGSLHGISHDIHGEMKPPKEMTMLVMACEKMPLITTDEEQPAHQRPKKPSSFQR